jgi:hypothetical protein
VEKLRLNVVAVGGSAVAPKRCQEIVVEKEGFRPSEWVHMLDRDPPPGKADAIFPRYTPDGRVLVITTLLFRRDPGIFDHIIDFATMHGLNVHITPELEAISPGVYAALKQRC